MWGHGCDNGQPSQVAGGGGSNRVASQKMLCFSLLLASQATHVVSHPGVKVHTPPNSNPAGDKERVEWVTKS